MELSCSECGQNGVEMAEELDQWGRGRVKRVLSGECPNCGEALSYETFYDKSRQ